MFFWLLRFKTFQIKAAIFGVFILGYSCVPYQTFAQASADEEIRIVIDSQGWQLVGDLRLPAKGELLPAVLMLNKAAGDRTVYSELARYLAARGIASLRLDLRGHGESINLGRFIPGEQPRSPFIWDAEIDVITAYEYLKSYARIDANRVGIVGGSYSGEEMAEAGRKHGYAQAYVVLSPGSFSDESIFGIDSSGVPWLFITSKNDRFLHEIETLVQNMSRTVEMVFVPGDKHATSILEARPDVAERIAVWIARQLLD